MKTSNKWLLAALLLLLGSLSVYNTNLRAEYGRGAYKDPTRNMKALNFRNFTEIDLQAASQMGVKVVAGPYSVRVNNEAVPFVKVSQRGERLIVGLMFPKGRESLGGRNVMTISLPQLTQLTTGATYSVEGKTSPDTHGSRGSVGVQGFRQDSLLVRQDYDTEVELADNQLTYLRAEAGRQPGSSAVLRIAKTNRIAATDLNLQARSELELAAGNIGQLRGQFGDSVRATLTGAGLGSLSQR